MYRYLIILIFILGIFVLFNNKNTNSKMCNNPNLDNETSACLCDCDDWSDYCYNNCNNNPNCIKKCYEIKAQCYMACLGTSCNVEPSECNC